MAKDITDLKKESFQQTYEIQGQLGEGSGGTVYKAFHKNLQKYVVLKKMHAETAEVLNRRSETDALKNLRHPYIPQVLDFIELDDGVYTVMDFIPGESFGNLLKQGRRFSQKEAIKYARQLFEVLTYIHSRQPKVIHGDIKPDNLMLTPQGDICLIDFNISGVADGNGAIIEGFTNGYSAPEQIEGFRNLKAEADKAMQQTVEFSKAMQTLRSSQLATLRIDERADIYSAAATIYHILTGQKPCVQNGVIPPANTIDPRVSDSFSYVLSHAMEQNPAKRFQTSKDALNALNDMHKLDRRYKSLVRQQNILFVVAMLFICIGVGLIVRGMNLGSREKVERYNQNIEQMQEYAASVQPGDTSYDDEVAELYEDCLSINDKQIDAYLYQAVYLYRQKNYEDTLNYIDKYIFSDVTLTTQSGIETVNYIYASSLMNSANPDYQDAIKYYNKAIDGGYDGTGCYRELAECHLNMGNLEKAEETLANATSSGISGSDMELMAGEIALAKGDESGATGHYENSIQMAEASGEYDVLLRAYLGLNDACLAKEKTEQTLTDAIAVLERAQASLPSEYQIQILQSQVQNYVDAFQLTNYRPYIQSGIDLIEKSINNGWKDYNNYTNLAFLYEQDGNFDRAKEILEGLTNDYPDNYVAFKRLCYLEADYQATLPVSSRNYTIFEAYYTAAKAKYSQSGNAAGDLEMDFLDQMYNEAKANGWLK